MADFRQILKNIREGKASPFLQKLYRMLFKLRSHNGTAVLDEEWDCLIILDACRYDVFEEVNDIEGELTKKTSKASNSFEWLQKNFADYYEDIVYISANPYVTPSEDGGFRSDEHFDHVYPLILEEDLQEKDVVAPEKLTEKTLDIISKNRDKRVIVHFMQPHIPYIGEKDYPGKTVAETANEKGDDFLLEVYKSNLRRVLNSVDNLVDELEGKIVVSADHGEMLGEYSMYGHYPEVYFRELVEVPWLEMQGRGDIKLNLDSDLTGVDL